MLILVKRMVLFCSAVFVVMALSLAFIAALNQVSPTSYVISKTLLESHAKTVRNAENYIAQFMYVTACSNGQLKLRGGKYFNEGTVLVCYNKMWGLISDAAWSDGDARVVCNSMGYRNGSKK